MEVNGSEHGKKNTNGDGIYYFFARPACFNAHFTPRGTLNALISALNCKLSALSLLSALSFTLFTAMPHTILFRQKIFTVNSWHHSILDNWKY